MATETSFPLQVLYFLLFVLILLFILYMLGKIRRDALDGEFSYHHFSDLTMSSQEFYKTVEEVIAELAEPRIKTSRVTYFEGGMLSARREYLRVERDGLVYRICAAPFGHSYFISWRLLDTAELPRKIIRALPRIGLWLEAALYSRTYYQTDTGEVFKNFIEQVLREAIELIGSDKGKRGFAELGGKTGRAAITEADVRND